MSWGVDFSFVHCDAASPWFAVKMLSFRVCRSARVDPGERAFVQQLHEIRSGTAVIHVHACLGVLPSLLRGCYTRDQMRNVCIALDTYALKGCYTEAKVPSGVTDEGA